MIGRTRHPRIAKPPRLSSPARPRASQSCGELIHAPSAAWYRHARFAPPAHLADWIEHYWLESWRVRANATQRRELLPRPCVQFAFSPKHARIYGVQQGRFIRTYKGEGRVFGISFRAGAFYPFFHKSVSSLSNSSIDAAEVFACAAEVGAQIFRSRGARGMVDAASQFLTVHLPPDDPNVPDIAATVDLIAADRKVTRVHHIGSRFGASERALQRLFRRYVGASPRWVIKRYRAYEALDHLNNPRPPRLAAVAQELGYFDQAHFANDFKNRVGHAPSHYTERALLVKGRTFAGS